MNTFNGNFKFLLKIALKNFFLISILLCSSSLFAQKLEVIFHVPGEKLEGPSKKRTQVADSISATMLAQEKIIQLQDEGFLTASIDSISKSNDTLVFYLNKGEQFRWIKLGPGNINEAVLSRIGYRDKLYFNTLFDAHQFSDMMQKLLHYYENNGYPFAQIKLDSVQLSKDGISANLQLEKNILLKIDSVPVKGNPPITERYLHGYLGVKPGDIYNHALLMDISNKIREIPFLKETRPFQIQYFEEKTKVVLFLEKNQASSFNGILGASTNEETQQIQFTGDIDLNLINAFHRGENIRFQWRSLEEQSQDLRFKFLYPYLLGSPLGFDFDFGLFKKDTTYINLETVIGIRYFLKANDYFKVFVQNRNSNLLSKQSYIAEAFPSLPSYADSELNLYGIEYSIERLNYRYNPTKGFAMLANFAFGTKRINKIPELEEKNPRIYDNVQLKSQQYNGFANLRYFFQLSQRNTILLANKSAITNNENLFRNELLRIGGLKTLRGFDEESLYASAYSIFTLEYRFLLDRNSFLSVFSDAAYYENNSNETYVKDWPIGIGAGISFETGAGIFTLNYALGRQFGNPFYFRSGKIHFGFINFF